MEISDTIKEQRECLSSYQHRFTSHCPWSYVESIFAHGMGNFYLPWQMILKCILGSYWSNKTNKQTNPTGFNQFTQICFYSILMTSCSNQCLYNHILNTSSTVHTSINRVMILLETLSKTEWGYISKTDIRMQLAKNSGS